MDPKRKYWSDIVIALDAIDHHLGGVHTFEDYTMSVTVKDAVERRLITIGEAVNKLVHSTRMMWSRMHRRSALSEIDWSIRTTARMTLWCGPSYGTTYHHYVC